MLEHVASSAEHYMNLLSAREKLIASNIANADTPGYRTRDIDFEAEYRRALHQGSPAAQPSATVDVPGLRLKNDGNNVSLDREMRMLSETALRFNIATNFARSEMRQIRLAIDDGRQA
jgi:flagellar basal-body rod protein FlgB